MAPDIRRPTDTGSKEQQVTTRARPTSRHRKLCSIITNGLHVGRRDLQSFETTKIWNVSISKLQMNGYIIIGEQPTYPHNIISIKRPPDLTVPTSPSYHGIGTIVLWNPTYLTDLFIREHSLQRSSQDHPFTSYQPRNRDEPSSSIIARHAAYSIESNISLAAGEKDLLGLHTFWDTRRDQLCQFQFYASFTPVFTNPIYAYGFVYGKRQYAVFTPEGTEEGGYSVCFRGLSGPMEGAHIKAITGSRLMVFEPFVEKFRKHTIAAWSEHRLNWKEENGYDGCISNINLLEVALEALRTTSRSPATVPGSQERGYETPAAAKAYVCFSPGYLDRKSSSFEEWMDHRNNIDLTLGFVVPKAKEYHFFQFRVILPKRTVRVLRMLKIGNFSRAYYEHSAEALFLYYAKRCRLIPGDSKSVRHVCTQNCVDKGLQKEELRAFVDYNVAESVSSLLLPKNGVRLLATDQRQFRESRFCYDQATGALEEDDEYVSTDICTDVSFGSMLSSDDAPTDVKDDDGDILMNSQRDGDFGRSSRTGLYQRKRSNEPSSWTASAGFGSFTASFGSTEPDEDMADSSQAFDSQASTVKPSQSQSQEEEDPYLAVALEGLVEGKEYEPESDSKKRKIPLSQGMPLSMRGTKAAEGGLFGTVDLLPTCGEGVGSQGSTGKRGGSDTSNGPIKRARLLKNDGCWDMSDSE
ncbi:hypothetical protein BJ508DRAFT_379575 [Ascobolus immersus RN42]|uniref:Uncharacterized protein n=1 Tax=Ascobolus immersus RN42 TaxID=1160509 RepID=A0A3N4I331_ASCIM|nr:hypothetical protein BJ508DRAFT_379575 [Ascobolus immersus RN42]